LKPNLNLELKTLEKINRKGIRKSREKEKNEMQPSRPNSAQLGRAPAPPDKWDQPISGSSLSRALPLSLSLPTGADLSAPVSSPGRFSSLSASRARFASC
jgi:hypothetical protein